MTGTVCLQGGAELTVGCRDMDADLLRRAGGRVVVTALAGAVGSDYRTATANGVRHFRELGAADVVGAPDVREDPAAALAALRSARLLVLPGGSPARLLAALSDSGAGAVVIDLLADGAVVMGSSAGAMVLCAWTVLPDRPSPAGPAVVRGLGVVPDVLVLPHWSAEGGRVDWLRAVHATVDAGTTVLGLAEQSGVLVEGRTLMPVGRWAARLVSEQRDLPLGRPWTLAGERSPA
jgi:cyanophycinase-like exopeptidase